MGSDRSVTLISRLFLLNFLLLWQLGTGTCTFDDRIEEVVREGYLPDDEVRALRLLSQSLQSKYPVQSSSLELSLSYPICSGEKNAEIKCGSSDNSSNRSFRSVTGINLHSKLMLEGSIHYSIGFFKNLETLILYDNQLSGGIPSTMGKLQHLNHLDLSGNWLTGSIPPSLTVLQNLESLYLSNNQLTGVIPKELGKLSALNNLDLSRNKLTGVIPKELGKLSALNNLAFSYNKLSGVIPKELGKLSALHILLFINNDLDGELPHELGNLINVQDLNFASNHFTGTIPDTYAKLINMKSFVVGGNNLTGRIPHYIGKWMNLTVLNLVGNNFEGNLPAETFRLPKLQILWVSDVSNPGISFPPEVKSQPKFLSVLILRHCKINGSIPEYIGKWRQLSYLDLSFNNLRGSIPETLETPYKLILTNMLDGLPSWIINPQKSNPNFSPTTWDLSYNNFNVTCENRTCLGLQNVNIYPTRSFTKKQCRLKHNSLSITNDRKNHYHDDTSMSSFNLNLSDGWTYSSIMENLVSGPVDDEDIVSITYHARCLRKGTYTMTVHFAEPLFYEDYDYINPRAYDVYIERRITRKDLIIAYSTGKNEEERRLNFPVKINGDSLEIQLLWTGKGSIYEAPAFNGPMISAVSITPAPRKLHSWEIALIIVGCILFLLLLLAFMWRLNWIGDRELRETKLKIGERTFTLKQIIDATKKFSPKMELGRGRSGIVYRAPLPDLTVAVKRLFAQSKAVNEISSEVYAKKALDLKHDNLVKLLASYSRNHLHLLIYEYMELGSLGQVLFGTNSTVQIDWQKRYIICRGIAKGLKYLHERNPQIIHRNIKTTNILLEASCNPKISDFGLAKLYEEENPYTPIGAGGDLLYMAPEYATRRAITVKVDVYSFGILLLEIVSGRNNAEYRANQETVFLLDTAGNLHAQGRLGGLVDPRLRAYDWDQANSVLKLAMMCTDQSPSLRPTMSQVVALLEGEKTLEDLSEEITPST